MPNPESSYSFFEDLYDLVLGRGLPTLIAAIITILISFVINKLFVKQEMKLKSYIGLFCIIFIFAAHFKYFYLDKYFLDKYKLSI